MQLAAQPAYNVRQALSRPFQARPAVRLVLPGPSARWLAVAGATSVLQENSHLRVARRIVLPAGRADLTVRGASRDVVNAQARVLRPSLCPMF